MAKTDVAILFAVVVLVASAIAWRMLPRRVVSTAPDNFGVVCYYIDTAPSDLSCVKVAP